ncbi:hypothetical protein R5R35_012930 [Gryllus longicercus]|uniref:Copine-3 n=1 Tax=Gryllus longicercus TaxID=2509291 RepID=A0AAN9ZG10_9ORTH
MSTFTPGTAAQCTTEVELSFSCRNLPYQDVMSKSDPMVVVYIKPFGEERWQEVHRTETIQNNHEPNFAKKFNVHYRFEEQQPLKFEVYDVDSNSTRLADHDFIGTASCSLANIVASGKVQLPLGQIRVSGDQPACIIVTAEELQNLKDEVWLEFHGQSLDKKNWLWWKSDPFLVFYKSTESGDFVVVHKTEVQHTTLNPRWHRFSLPVRSLCNGDYDRNIKVVCMSYRGNGDHSLIGEFYTTLRSLQRGPGAESTFPLISEKKKGRKNDYENSGQILLRFFELRKIHTFMDFLRGGTQLHCSIAIDFTGSNGNPTQPESLHFISPVQNKYEQAISAVGSIIQDYDSDKMFPVLGFGARLPPDGRVSHEFFVNMDSTNPYVQGIEGVLMAYRNCLTQIQLYGPTNFAPVINHVARFAQTYRDGSSYFILLILTDGVITDMPQTIEAIIAASSLPMSIIIVGIGTADFSAMETLDADTVALQSGGRRAQRDIVQFVPFSKFLNQGDARTARLRLAREVLAEVPTQFLGYMRHNNISPRPPTDQMVVLPPDPEQVRLS